MASRSDGAAVGGLAALTAVVFKDVLFGNRVLFERDIHFVWYGQVETLVRCLAAGSWPVWNPYVSFGEPYLAIPSTQVFYPWTWLNLILPPEVVYFVYAAAHVLLAGVGLYFLARRFELSRPAAFVGAAIFTCSGPIVSMVSLWHHLAGAAWMPWVLLAADRALRSPSLGRSLLWGAAYAGQILAGSADMCAMTGLMMAAHALSLWRGQDRLALAGLLKAGTLAVAFALCLSAASWVPAADIARRSARWGLDSSLRTMWSLHPVHMLQSLLPILPGDVPLDLPARRALFDQPNPFLTSIYIGVPALALAAAAFAGARPVWVWGLIATAAWLVALGRHTWFYAVLVQVLPPLKILRYPVKAMAPAAFAISLLCAFGFEVWAGAADPRGRRWRIMVALPAVAGSALLWAATWMAFHPEAWSAGLLGRPPQGGSLDDALGPAARKLVAAALLASAAALLAWTRLLRPAHARASAVAVAVVTVAGLLQAGRGVNPTAPADFYRERPPVLEVLKKDGASRLYVFDYQRIVGKSYRNNVPNDVFVNGRWSAVEGARATQAYLYPPTGTRWGFFGSYESDTYSLHSPQLRSLTLVLRSGEETPLHERLLRMASVDHVVALHEAGLEGLQPVAAVAGPFANPIRVFRVPDPLPRAYAVSGVRIADGLQTYRTLADPAFDPLGEVVLPEGGPERAAGRAGPTRILELRPDRLVIAADLDQPGHVVVLDTYDPGWKATVDGRAAPVLRANGAFRAIPVHAGSHVVEMVYRPMSIRVGLLASAAAVLLGVGALVARNRTH
jgi:hypothetical protein